MRRKNLLAFPLAAFALLLFGDAVYMFTMSDQAVLRMVGAQLRAFEFQEDSRGYFYNRMAGTTQNKETLEKWLARNEATILPAARKEITKSVLIRIASGLLFTGILIGFPKKRGRITRVLAMAAALLICLVSIAVIYGFASIVKYHQNLQSPTMWILSISKAVAAVFALLTCCWLVFTTRWQTSERPEKVDVTGVEATLDDKEESGRTSYAKH